MLSTRRTPARLSLLWALCIFAMQGACGLQCYTCKDTGDGACDPTRSAVVECPIPTDVCLESLTTVNISFTSLKVLTKGCGDNSTSIFPLDVDRAALRTVTEITACASDRCNSRQFLSSEFPYVNITFDTSPLNTSLQCYGCLGTSLEMCSDSQASAMNCSGEDCAEGVLSIQMSNRDFLTVFFKDCGRWGRFAALQLQNSVKVDFRRTTCTGDLCNREPEPTTMPARTTRPRDGSAAIASSPVLLALVLAFILA